MTPLVFRVYRFDVLPPSSWRRGEANFGLGVGIALLFAVSYEIEPDGRLRFWRAEVDRLRAVVARLAKDYRAVHVKTQDVFDAAAKLASPAQWIWDGVHPLPQGHELIARNWLQEVSALEI